MTNRGAAIIVDKIPIITDLTAKDDPISTKWKAHSISDDVVSDTGGALLSDIADGAKRVYADEIAELSSAIDDMSVSSHTSDASYGISAIRTLSKAGSAGTTSEAGNTGVNAEEFRLDQTNRRATVSWCEVIVITLFI